MVEIKPNANFHSLAGSAKPDNPSEIYEEYRRCWVEYPTQFILKEFPMHLDIESTNRCNLQCTFCDRQRTVSENQFGDMDMNLYKKIIDEGARNNLWGIKLSYRGEPLLHPHIVQMVAYAKQKGILDVYFNTNGMLLNERMSSNLIEAGLDRISISVEGTDPIAYEKMRINAKFDVVLKNIEILMDLKARKGLKYPKVRVQSVDLPGFNSQDYIEFWSGRCDEVAMLDYTDIDKRLDGIIHNWACPQLWQRMTIQWNGIILPCNNDDLGLLSVGNVKDRTILECWNDPNIQSIRELHRQGHAHKVKDCNGCPWRTAQLQKK